MKANYTRQDIENALSQLKVGKGDLIFLHSNIGFFGMLEGAKSAKDICSTFDEVLRDCVGSQGTIVHPTFSYSFCRREEFDVANTPGVCGVLSEYARNQPSYTRYGDANFSVVVSGALSEQLTKNPTEHSFGPNCFWERFLANEGKFVNLNFDAGSTFVHFVEKELNVSYRYDKSFEGVYVNGKNQEQKAFIHYVRDLDEPKHEPVFDKFDAKAKALDLAQTAKLGRGQILTITAEDTRKLIREEIKSNPNLLIKG